MVLIICLRSTFVPSGAHRLHSYSAPIRAWNRRSDFYLSAKLWKCNKQPWQDAEQHGGKQTLRTLHRAWCFECPHNGCHAAPLCCHADGWGGERRRALVCGTRCLCARSLGVRHTPAARRALCCQCPTRPTPTWSSPECVCSPGNTDVKWGTLCVPTLLLLILYYFMTGIPARTLTAVKLSEGGKKPESTTTGGEREVSNVAGGWGVNKNPQTPQRPAHISEISPVRCTFDRGQDPETVP